MDTLTHQKVYSYISNQLAQAEGRLRAYTVDSQGQPYPVRSAALVLNKYVHDYSQLGKEPRWIAVPGLRGVGKTTLLAQIYTELNCPDNRKLYISLDEAKNVLNVSLTDILTVYEEILGTVFEELKQPIYLFIDEVQYEEKWGLILKSLYDRSNKVFIFCTGSSAISLQSNPDVSRRLVIEKLFPMCFTEYLMLKEGRKPVKGLGQHLRDVLFASENAQHVHEGLTALAPSVRRYWAGVERLEIDRYLRYGTLPFAIQLSEEPLIYKQIEQTLSNVQYKDIPQVKQFEQATLGKMNQVLYMVASTDTVVVNKLAPQLEIAINTLSDMFEVFEKSEILLRIYPHASHINQAKHHTKRPSKYLFCSPAYRSMFFNLIGSIISFDNYKGKLLEDAVGLTLYRLFSGRLGASLTYDSAEGGADFVLGLADRKIPIEVGYGEKDFRQVSQTLKRIGGNYGLSISMSALSLSEDRQSVLVPLSYFLLI